MKLIISIVIALAFVSGCGEPRSSENAVVTPQDAEQHLLQPPPPNERDVSTFSFVVRIDEKQRFNVADSTGDLPELVDSLRSLDAKDLSPILIQSHVSHRLYERAYSILTRAGFKKVAWNTYK